jgi:hypothetical protein
MDMEDFATRYAERASDLTDRWNEAREASQCGYDHAEEEARVRRTEARRALDAAYITETDEAEKVRSAARSVADARLAEDTEALIQELTGNGGDDVRLAAWMIKAGWWRRFPEHCTQIIEAMPMTFEQFQGFKEQHSPAWCSDYDIFLSNALQAGVIPGVTPLAGAMYVMQQAIAKADIYSSDRRPLTAAFEQLAALLPQTADAVTEKSEA